MSSAASHAETEREAQLLAARVHQAIAEEILQMARLLLAKTPRDLFGPTEFDLRDLLHRAGAKAYELALAQKKTATSAPASTAPTVDKPPSSTATVPQPR